jgi:DNA-binding NtrC family response regulator
MPSLGHILIVDDDADVLEAARLFLKKHAAAVTTEPSPENLERHLRTGRYDVILLDMNFTRDVSSGKEGLEWLGRILEIDPSAVVVMVTAFGDVGLAVQAIKSGATDFVLKPWQNEKLLATLLSASRLRASRLESERLRSRQERLASDLDHPFQEIIGVSPVLQRVFETIRKVAPTDANVLILGENGTGKELAARAIHRESQRRNEVFVNVDMGAISETLFESELFGHTKGAFTDARADRAGRFEIASGGTLFLDEIGNLSLPLQAKLLATLQRREIYRVGSSKPVPMDVRLICATNMPVYEMVRENTFRQDLLYRINTVEIRMPSLRERREDIPLLADFFLHRYARKYGRPAKSISAVAMARLERYSFPGNIRELQHMVERAVIMAEGGVLQPEDFFFSTPENGSSDGTDVDLTHLNLDDVEKMVVQKALQKHAGNVSRAADDLGLTRASLYRRMEKYGL